LEIFTNKGAPPVSTTPAVNFITGTAVVVDTGANLPPVSKIPAANLSPVSTTLVAIATGINDTGGKFATGVNDDGGKLWEQYQNANTLKRT
jgi:hypothetical protein